MAQIDRQSHPPILPDRDLVLSYPSFFMQLCEGGWFSGLLISDSVFEGSFFERSKKRLENVSTKHRLLTEFFV